MFLQSEYSLDIVETLKAKIDYLEARLSKVCVVSMCGKYRSKLEPDLNCVLLGFPSP